MEYKNPNHPFVVWVSCFLWMVAIFAIIWSLVLFFCVGDMLLFTGTDIVNAFVLFSGLIMLPINIYNFHYIANGKKIECHGKVLCYPLWLCIVCIVIINFGGAVLCIRRIYSCEEFTMQFISQGMDSYRTVPKNKRFMDNIQWSLKCCGLHSYQDWFSRDWHDKTRDYEWDPPVKLKSKTVELESDSVPLSCCKSGSCISNYLKELGTYAINTVGCGYSMHRIIMTSMIIHLMLFLTVIVTEVLMLYYMNKTEKQGCTRKGTRKFNVRSIMSVNDNFPASSLSYQLNSEDSYDSETEERKS